MNKEQRVQAFVAELTIAGMMQDTEAWWRAQNNIRWYPARVDIEGIKADVVQRIADAKGITKAEGKSLELTILEK